MRPQSAGLNRIRTHASLALGLGLPLALVVYDALSAWLPGYVVAPPRYDAIYLTGYNEFTTNTAHIKVSGEHAALTFAGENFGYGWPRLYRFSAASGGVSEIPIDIPGNLPVVPPYNRPVGPASEEKITPVPVPELEKLRLDTSRTAPDGYRFTPGHETPPSLLSRWLVSQRGYHLAVIGHYGNKVILPLADNMQSNQSVKFLGWVLP